MDLHLSLVNLLSVENFHDDEARMIQVFQSTYDNAM